MAPLPSFCLTRSTSSKALLAKFATNRSGNFSIMFAILAVPLISAVGIAVDLSRAYRVTSITQYALDSAALAAGRAGQTNTTNTLFRGPDRRDEFLQCVKTCRCAEQHAVDCGRQHQHHLHVDSHELGFHALPRYPVAHVLVGRAEWCAFELHQRLLVHEDLAHCDRIHRRRRQRRQQRRSVADARRHGLDEGHESSRRSRTRPPISSTRSSGRTRASTPRAWQSCPLPKVSTSAPTTTQ